MSTVMTQQDDTRFLVEYISGEYGAGQSEIRIEKREYHVFASSCAQDYVEISNNDNGYRHIFLKFTDWSDLSIDWSGSRLVFHGVVIPFLFTGSSNIRMRNLEIDWWEDHHVEMTAEASNGDRCDFIVENDAEPVQVRGTLICSSNVCVDPSRLIQHLMPVDRDRKEPARGADEVWLHDGYRSSMHDGTITIVSEQMRQISPGTAFILENHLRPAPAIVLSDCADISLSSLTIHYAIGMALVAQNCTTVSVSRVNVIPSSRRTISTLADAFHFVQCRGTVSVEDCICRSQMDDAINVHGFYATLDQATRTGELSVTLNHHQQLGNAFARVGDRVRVYRKKHFTLVAESVIRAITRLNHQRSTLELEDEISLSAGPHVIENVSAYPEVRIARNTFDSNRARSILVSSPRRVVIEDNYLRSGGAAIRISGDDRDWYESGQVDDVLIRRNVFDDCNYATEAWGKAVIDIDPDLTCPHPEAPYHGCVTVTGNEFRAWNSLGLVCSGAREIVFSGNSTEGNQPFLLHIDPRTRRTIEGDNLQLIEGNEQ